jgi:nucleotide-binding universal stress UspA family protein
MQGHAHCLTGINTLSPSQTRINGSVHSSEKAMKILLSVDGSDYTKRMLAYIAAHDELLGGGHEYIAFTATIPIPPHLGHFLTRETIDNYHREEAERVLRPVEQFAAQLGWNMRVCHEAVSPASAIVSLAEKEKVDLIVMGTHGHTALVQVVMGSVTSAVLARCKIPLLLIH